MPTSLHLTGDTAADRLLTKDPLALLLGMVLDQQIPMEWAFKGPFVLSERLGGTLSAQKIASMELEHLKELFSEKPALHRYPGSMATRCQEVCQAIVDDYDGSAANIWTKASDGADLFRRVKGLPGFGEMKAKIFIALLGKQVGVKVEGWEQVSAPYSQPGVHRSVADIVDTASLEKVREFKAAAKKAAKASK
jgi:uncharacterized HhH-GPD family protein